MNPYNKEEPELYPEDNVPPPAERTAEMPMLWDEAHRTLIDSCVRSISLYPLLIQLPKLADDLEGNKTLEENNFSVEFTVEALRDIDSSMCALLHSMAPNVVKSIVKNTIAFDDFNGHVQCFPMPTTPSVEIPGVYVVGLMRSNKGGRFLDIKEMELLIDSMKNYVQGYKAYVKLEADADAYGRVTAKANQTKDEHSALRFLCSVDAKAGGNFSEKPLFIEKDEEIPRIEALIATYAGMCDRSLDPEGDIRMLQSPLYVGCSKNLAKRTKIYEQHSVRSMNKPLGLTISILRHLNLPVELRVMNVLRILKADQLPMAEQLVTTIAGSLIYQHGFNAVEAGGTGFNTVVSEDGLKINVGLVIARLGIMIDNLDNSIGEADLRQRFLRDIESVQEDVAEINKDLKECVETLESLPPDFRWDENLSEVEKLVQSLKEDLEDKNEALRFWELMLEIQKIIFNETGHGIDLL